MPKRVSPSADQTEDSGKCKHKEEPGLPVKNLPATGLEKSVQRIRVERSFVWRVSLCWENFPSEARNQIGIVWLKKYDLPLATEYSLQFV